MKEQFVTYEIATRLKELGFDEPCLGNWRLIDSGPVFSVSCDMYSTSQEKTSYIFGVTAILAPLWQQVIDWLRDKHGIGIEYHCLSLRWYSQIFPIDPIHQYDRIQVNLDDNLSYSENQEKTILKTMNIVNDTGIFERFTCSRFL